MDNTEPKELKFKCISCGGTRLNSVENVTLAYPVNKITEDGVDSYGEHEGNYEGGEGVQYYECNHCNEMLYDEADDLVTTEEELVEWIKYNCEQE